MKQIASLILILTILSSCVVQSGASGTKDEGKPTDVQVEVGKVTEAIFPAKVAKVIKGGVSDSILVEVLDNSVYLLPKTNELTDIFVTTVSGISYPLTLHIGNNHDIKIKIGSFNNAKSMASSGNYSDEMDLMKDLLLQKEPVGATVLPGSGQVFLANQQIELTVDKVYELLSWRAYVLVARNLMKKVVILPLEQLSLPNLVAITSDRDMLAAQGQEGDTTRVYVIVGQ